jgi:hypothetical protein
MVTSIRSVLRNISGPVSVACVAFSVFQTAWPMPTYPDRAPRRHPLQWFALSITGGFFLSFFVTWVFAALLALSLGAVATGFDQARQEQRVSAWLAVPATGVFAFALGSFLQGFLYEADQANIDVRARVMTGGAEVILMIFSGGNLPFEGVARISPWRHVAVTWVVLTTVVLLLGWWRARRRGPS